MMDLQSAPEQLFYDFPLEDHVPGNHLLRKIDQFRDLGDLRTKLAPFYSSIGRPSVDPELMIRMLLAAYCFVIRSERWMCEEVHLNLAYRWFCGLGLDGKMPDHSTFSLNRNRRKARKLVRRVATRGKLTEEKNERTGALNLDDALIFPFDQSSQTGPPNAANRR